MRAASRSLPGFSSLASRSQPAEGATGTGEEEGGRLSADTRAIWGLRKKPAGAAVWGEGFGFWETLGVEIGLEGAPQENGGKLWRDSTPLGRGHLLGGPQTKEAKPGKARLGGIRKKRSLLWGSCGGKVWQAGSERQLGLMRVQGFLWGDRRSRVHRQAERVGIQADIAHTSLTIP